MKALIDASSGSFIFLDNDVTKLTSEEETFVNGILIDGKARIDANGHTITSNNGKVFTVAEGSSLELNNAKIVGDGNSAIVNDAVLTLSASNPTTFENVGEYAIENSGRVSESSLTTFTQLSDLIGLVNGGEVYIGKSVITKAADEKETFKDGIVVENNISLIGYVTTKGVINTVIDADNDGRIFSINDGATLTFKLILKNGNAENGGAVYVEANNKLIAYNVNFIDNTAADNGGAIYTDGGNITLNNCVLNANDVKNLETSASQNMGGAAIYAKNAQVTLVNTNVTNNGRNELDRSNGDMINAVINLINSDATITGGLFENNTGIYGGAVFAKGGSLEVSDSQFISNTAYVGWNQN